MSAAGKLQTRIAFLCHDGLSTLIFARWYAAQFQGRSDVRFYTVSGRDSYGGELDAIGSEHIEITTGRFIDPFRDLRYWWRLYRACRRERFDVVVTFGTKPNIYGPLAARLAGTRRVILAVRGLGRAFNQPDSVSGHALSWLLHRLYRLSCACADRVWFTNDHDRDYMVSHRMVAADRTFVTTNSVDPDFFSTGHVSVSSLVALRQELQIADHNVVVVMVARLLWLKGIAEYVAAARKVRATYPHARFVLVAPLEDSSPNAVPAEYVAAAQKSGDLTWLEFRKDVREIYQMADIAVLPSYYKEGGYPRALLEPMALGKPVIAADTRECRGPVEPDRNGFLVPPRDVGALAARIGALVADPELRERFGRRSRQLVLERFSDDIVGRVVLAEMGVAA